MIFVDDLKNAINIILHPRKATTKQMSISDSLVFYYKVSVIPAIIFIILAAIGSATLGSVLASHGLGIGIGAALVIVFGLIVLWIVAPIGLLIDAAILYLFGKILLKKFKGDYSNTLTGFVYGELPILSLVWIPVLLLLVSPVIGLVVFVVLAIWDLVVGIIALANQNKTSALTVIGVIIVEIVVIFIIEFLIVLL